MRNKYNSKTFSGYYSPCSADSTSEVFEQNDFQSLAEILSSDQISDQDLLAHRYYYAKITCFQVDVTNLPTSLADLPPKYLEIY